MDQQIPLNKYPSDFSAYQQLCERKEIAPILTEAQFTETMSYIQSEQAAQHDSDANASVQAQLAIQGRDELAEIGFHMLHIFNLVSSRKST